MEAARQRVKAAAAHKKEEDKKTKAGVRAAVARKKEEDKKTKAGESSSAPKAVSKEVAKRKNDGNDDPPSNKASVIAGEKLSKKPSPKKHGAGKWLMTTLDPVT